MNSAGQAIIETVILTAIFMLLVAAVAQKLPLTFSEATPYLGSQVEARLQTGVGFSQSNLSGWSKPLNPKGGMR
jgi:hypothetical protein